MTDQPPHGRMSEPRDTEPFPVEPGPTGSGADDDTQPITFSPTPEQRPEWARPAWLDAPAQPALAAATSSGPPPPGPISPGSISPGATPPGAMQPGVIPTEPVRQTQQQSRGVGFGSVVAAAVLSAILASGGTVVLLESTGALDRTGGAGPSAAGPAGSRAPAPPEDQSAVVNAAATVSPAVVRI